MKADTSGSSSLTERIEGQHAEVAEAVEQLRVLREAARQIRESEHYSDQAAIAFMLARCEVMRERAERLPASQRGFAINFANAIEHWAIGMDEVERNRDQITDATEREMLMDLQERFEKALDIIQGRRPDQDFWDLLDIVRMMLKFRALEIADRLSANKLAPERFVSSLLTRMNLTIAPWEPSDLCKLYEVWLRYGSLNPVRSRGGISQDRAWDMTAEIFSQKKSSRRRGQGLRKGYESHRKVRYDTQELAMAENFRTVHRAVAVEILNEMGINATEEAWEKLYLELTSARTKGR